MKRTIKLVDFIKYCDADTKSVIEESVGEVKADSELVIERFSGAEIKSVGYLAEGTDLAEGTECSERTDECISEGYASTRVIDFSGDIVIPEGINLNIFKKNPIIFYNHFQSSLPIGKATKIKADEYGLFIKIKYAVEENKEAETIYKLVKGGYIKQHSIGFLPLKVYYKGTNEYIALNKELKKKYKEYKGEADRIITEALLLEVSIVNIADNQASEIMNVKGISIEDIKSLNKLGANIKLDEKEIEPVDGIKQYEECINNQNKEEKHIELIKHLEKPVIKREIVVIHDAKEVIEVKKKIDIKVIKEATRRGTIIRE